MYCVDCNCTFRAVSVTVTFVTACAQHSAHCLSNLHAPAKKALQMELSLNYVASVL